MNNHNNSCTHQCLLFVLPIQKTLHRSVAPIGFQRFLQCYHRYFRNYKKTRILLVAQKYPGTSHHQVRPLTRQVIEKIQCDEIIQSPVDVVRELLENAIDAKADIITLEQDMKKIRVVDNGMGMSLQNLELCIQSHTTSKISSVDDLHHIDTLGFRGQALWAISTYCESLCITSRPASESVGYRLEHSLAIQYQAEPVPHDIGTCVQVSLHEAASRQHEKLIRNLFQRYALIYPNISFRFRKNGKRPYNIVYPKCRHYFERVVQILPIPSNELRYHQVKIQDEQHYSIGHIQLVIGLPERIHRARNDWIWTSINGRLLEQSIFSEMILEKTKKMIPSGRYPLCFVWIQLEPKYVLWDCSAKKLGIQVKHCIQNELVKKIVYCMDKALEMNVEMDNDEEWKRNMIGYPDSSPQQSGDTFQKWKVVAQVKRTYIVVETDSSVLLLEQHVAHEGVLFEKLCELWRSKPEFVSFHSMSSSLLLQEVPQVCIDRWKQLHIHARSLDGIHTWAIDEMPQIIVDMLHHNSPWEAQLFRIANPQRNLEDNLADFACRCAWNNGMELTEYQMDTLVHDWMQLKGNKRTCPHGRPIFVQLHDNYLSRLFKRTWTTVKEM